MDPLIVRHRPKAFDQVVGQKAALQMLDTLIQSQASRCFLFTGPSGVGKTTLARLTAIALGCDEADIQEVDGPTYTNVQELRTLTANLHLRPFTKSGFKAIIVDECQSFSSTAWNVLLKATEEPPRWLYWLFCTTELGRVPPETRCACC